jgi:hypothetical protein
MREENINNMTELYGFKNIPGFFREIVGHLTICRERAGSYKTQARDIGPKKNNTESDTIVGHAWE